MAGELSPAFSAIVGAVEFGLNQTSPPTSPPLASWVRGGGASAASDGRVSVYPPP